MQFYETMELVKSACNQIFYRGCEGLEEAILKSATDIYITQKLIDAEKEIREQEEGE